jgi:hypothetical protein
LSLSYKFEPSKQQQAENLRSQFEIFPNFGECGRRLVRLHCVADLTVKPYPSSAAALPPAAVKRVPHDAALPPKADMCSAQAYVRFVPIADMGLALRGASVNVHQRENQEYNCRRDKKGYLIAWVMVVITLYCHGGSPLLETLLENT